MYGNGDFSKEVTILITKEGCQNMVKLFWDLYSISSLEVCVMQVVQERERPLTWNKERHRTMTWSINTDTIGKRFKEKYLGTRLI